MFSAAFSALWLMVGYLILLIMLGMFTSKLAQMKGLKAMAGYLGAVFWLLGVIFYYILAQVGAPDALILIVISIAVPLFYLINLAAILLDKKHAWVDPEYKTKGLRNLLIFLFAFAIYAAGLVIA
jgi:hypothetical protein